MHKGNELKPESNRERSQAGRIRPGAVVLFLLVGFTMLVFMYLFYVQMQGRVGPEQPIPFSHRLHAGVKAIDCRFCHPFVERSAKAGLPTVGKCLYCHNYIIRKHPWIQEEHRYYETDEPTPWVRLFIVGDHVQFLVYLFVCQFRDGSEE